MKDIHLSHREPRSVTMRMATDSGRKKNPGEQLAQVRAILNVRSNAEINAAIVKLILQLEA